MIEDKKNKRKRKKKKKDKRAVSPKTVALLTRIGLVLVLFLTCLFIVLYYRVQTIIVSGAGRYNNDDIISMVMDSPLTENTLYLKWKYGKKAITTVPFIEKIDVQVVTHDTVKLNVYEKSLAGYISYLGQYMYFDREGIVVESGSEKIDGVPQVMGLKFDYVVLNERLPVENEAVFSQILSITQLLDKYVLDADRIFFDASYNMYLYFGSIECDLGSSNYAEEKLEQLVNILPELEGESGIIRLKDYTPGAGGVIFESR